VNLLINLNDSDGCEVGCVRVERFDFSDHRVKYLLALRLNTLYVEYGETH